MRGCGGAGRGPGARKPKYVQSACTGDRCSRVGGTLRRPVTTRAGLQCVAGIGMGTAVERVPVHGDVGMGSLSASQCYRGGGALEQHR